jgi:hypothetical protein
MFVASLFFIPLGLAKPLCRWGGEDRIPLSQSSINKQNMDGKTAVFTGFTMIWCGLPAFFLADTNLLFHVRRHQVKTFLHPIHHREYSSDLQA